MWIGPTLRNFNPRRHVGRYGRSKRQLRSDRQYVDEFRDRHALQENGPSRLSEIAAEPDLTESTIHRHLNTLCDLRYVSQQGERYQLGLRFARLGRAARTRDPAYAMAKQHVETLAAETEERSQFVVEDHGLGIYLHVETGSKAVRVGFDVGRQIHLHCSSAGKSILAHSPRSTSRRSSTDGNCRR